LAREILSTTGEGGLPNARRKSTVPRWREVVVKDGTIEKLKQKKKGKKRGPA